MARVAFLLFAAPVLLAAPVALTNGDFSDGLRGWEIVCKLELCAEATTESSSSGRAASLKTSADAWTAIGLRQRVAISGGGPLVAEASIQKSAYNYNAYAALEVRLSIVYENAAGTHIGSCAEERNELPAAWTPLSVSCAPPPAAAATFVLVEFACVRGAANLLVDSVTVSSSSSSSSAAVPTAAPPVALAPRIVHFIFGLSADFGGKPFGLVHHLVIKAALQSVKPTVAYFHHANLPSGVWWERTRPLLSLRRVKPPTQIFGNSVRRFAHQADVLRLELLLQFGGVYLDLDVLLLKPIEDGLLASSEGIVLAHEGIDGTIGAGNALMIVRRNHTLMHDWYYRYRKFSDQVWNGFSVRLPMEMAIAKPGSVKLLPYTAFYWPPWNPWGVAQIYRAKRCILPDSLGLHLWETKMWASLLGKLQPEVINKRDTCFSRLAASVLDGSYDFSSATLSEEQPAETADQVIATHDLASLLSAETSHEASERIPGKPQALYHFRQGQPSTGSAAGGVGAACEDRDASCPQWAASGECTKNPGFMLPTCRKSCGACEK